MCNKIAFMLGILRYPQCVYNSTDGNQQKTHTHFPPTKLLKCYILHSSQIIYYLALLHETEQYSCLLLFPFFGIQQQKLGLMPLCNFSKLKLCSRFSNIAQYVYVIVIYHVSWNVGSWKLHDITKNGSINIKTNIIDIHSLHIQENCFNHIVCINNLKRSLITKGVTTF